MAPDSEPTPRVPWLPVEEGARPAAPSHSDALTPTKPVVPAWIRREDVPSALEGDDGDIVAPFSAPPAAEVMPSLDSVGNATEAGDTLGEADAAAAEHPTPVQRLGESAVAAAALSAGGAPTPLGGVPTVPSSHAVTPPSFGDQGPAFTPIFTGEEPSEPSVREKADALAAGILAEETARLASNGTAFDGGEAYTPRVFGEDGAVHDDSAHGDAAAGDAAVGDAAVGGVAAGDAAATEPLAVPPTATAPADGDDGTQDPPPTKHKRWWLWALIAIVVIGAGVAAYLLLNRPEATVIPGVTVTEPPPAPTITPSAAPTGSGFQSAMPTEVGTYALVDAVVLDPADEALTVGRIADGVDLTYRSGADTITVRALQYYSEDDAKQMFTEFAGEDAATQPVEAGGTQVGDSAVITDPQPGMVWRNGTSVFIATGPADQVASFFALFGL